MDNLFRLLYNFQNNLTTVTAPSVIKRPIYILPLQKSLQISLPPLKQRVASIGGHTLQSQVLSDFQLCPGREREALTLLSEWPVSKDPTFPKPHPGHVKFLRSLVLSHILKVYWAGHRTTFLRNGVVSDCGVFSFSYCWGRFPSLKKSFPKKSLRESLFSI